MSKTPASTRTFEQWMDLVNQNVESKLGLSTADLPDCCYRDRYEDGASPKQAASRAIRNARDE